MKKPGNKITLENLAAMVAEGFENTATKSDISSVRTEIAKLEQGQEDIKLRLDSVAYRFELVELQKRVDRLELKTGITRR